ncbi:type 1 glutamine amidotransferase [Paenarthrobacter aurescens]|jgi:GMP synthase (glutamine-hydrolysing)|uniref:Glutamine amidotransferase n=1 Tax=Paenarthrobacter aurescens (strain TC1) TaxID=290340 RepID=A1RCH4_PAEAT|nr:type 1 glutamine amidotransferase [Paenarthrobacter aurescens]ABM10520.1 putative glutamine amidotransferase [Paenarthrobacter aurescens TC1]
MNSDPSRVTLLVIQPDPADPIDQFEPWFVKAGVEWNVVQPHAFDRVPEELDADGLLVLGGDMSSLHDHHYPWLEDIRALYRSAAKLRRPSLGICLGAQLMAQAFGGEVALGDSGLEAGVVRVHWREEADSDALVNQLPNPLRMGAMHGDMIAELPDDAEWLAYSDMYPHQAFRVRDSSWGVQFHPEIGKMTYENWVSQYSGGDPVAVQRLEHGRKQFAQQEDVVAQNTALFASRFAAIVRAAR